LLAAVFIGTDIEMIVEIVVIAGLTRNLCYSKRWRIKSAMTVNLDENCFHFDF